MNEHYLAVLADLEQLKADAEHGIRAIKRLLAKTNTVVTAHAKPRRKAADRSIQTLILEFLNRHPSKILRPREIATGIGIDGVANLRGPLSRLAGEKKIAQHGRGKYSASRRSNVETGG